MNTETEINLIKGRCQLEATNFALMQKDIEYVKQSIEKMKSLDVIQSEKLDTLVRSLENISEKLDGRYANKWVERAMSGLILLLVLSALYLIFDSAGLPR